MNISEKTFEAVALVARFRKTSKRYQAAKLVLCHGMSATQAAKTLGVTQPLVSNAVNLAKKFIPTVCPKCGHVFLK